MNIQKINTYYKKLLLVLRRLPRRYYIAGAFFVVIIVIAVVLWPRHVSFSYAGKTCFFQPSVAPGMLKSHSEKYRLEAANTFSIGSVALFARDICAVPLAAPQEGRDAVKLSHGALPFIQKAYSVTVSAPPEISLQSITTKPLSTTQTLTVPLGSPDAIFTYKLAVKDKGSVNCSVKTTTVSCPIQELKLQQGSAYAIEVERFFNGSRTSLAARQDIKTLTATAIVKSSIEAGQTVYAKPKTVEIETDKAVVDADIVLEKVDGDKRETRPLTVTYEDKKIVASWEDDLERQVSYELVARKVTGADGSGLEGPYTVRFQTSGGPKVKNISIGHYRVPTGTTAAITFDQPILGSQNLGAAVKATGGATVTGGEGTKVYVSFAGVPRCGDVSISISDALQSEHGITGGSSWQHATRALCQVQSSIGASSKGRPITAYAFGGGPQVVVYTGAIHGNEVSTRSLMLRWIDELEANPRAIPANKSIIVVPTINPDGVASGTRTNANNVDLNRNFATSDWKRDITNTSNKPFPGGGGTLAMSEPETRAIANLVSRVQPQLVLSYHSIGGLLAANQTGSSASRASQYSRLSGYANTTGSSDTFEYGISGTADDYYGQVLGVPSILVELGSHTYHQFERNQSAMWAMVK